MLAAFVVVLVALQGGLMLVVYRAARRGAGAAERASEVADDTAAEVRAQTEKIVALEVEIASVRATTDALLRRTRGSHASLPDEHEARTSHR